jgi:endonuclease/exonuclease/phosphatase family metal-dependent hydrolase
MKIVSWNMGAAPRAARYRRAHTAAWRYLLATLRPDIAFVQEALFVNPVSDDDGSLTWSDERGTDSGTAVFVRRGIDHTAVPIRSEGSYVAAVLIDLADLPVLFISIHVGPPNYSRHRQTLATTLSERTTGRRFVVGGDWNAARHWDTVHAGQASKRFFDGLAARGMVDCHWTQHQEEIQSVWRPQDKNGYQCDHLFVDTTTASAGGWDCEVISGGEEVRKLSDHDPIRLTVPFDVR